jgi:hypothetical protein
VPNIPEHLICMFCKHDCIDEPATNTRVRRRNNLKKVACDEQLASCNRALSFGEQPMTKDRKPITKTPSTPTHEDEVCHCHCSTMFCVSATQGTCRAGLVATVQQMDKDGICKCDVCLCPRAKACKVRLLSLFTRIMSIVAHLHSAFSSCRKRVCKRLACDLPNALTPKNLRASPRVELHHSVVLQRHRMRRK